MTPLQDGPALFAATGLYIGQYLVLFTALVGLGVLVKWTFTGHAHR